VCTDCIKSLREVSPVRERNSFLLNAKEKDQQKQIMYSGASIKAFTSLGMTRLHAL